MGQVPTRIKRQDHDGVAWLGERQHDRSVGLRAGMGLHIDEAAVEKLLGAVNGELLDFIQWSAALIIALAWIAFGIFVGEDRSLRFQQRFRNDRSEEHTSELQSLMRISSAAFS